MCHHSPSLSPTVMGRSPFPACLSWCLLLLPGFGNSAPSKEASTEAGRAELLERVLQDLQVQNAVLVSPSLSGHYALPFLMRGHHQLHGFVPIAPASTQNYTREQFWAVKVLGEGSPKVLASYHGSSLGRGRGKDSGLTWRTHGPILDLDGRDGFGEEFLRRWLEGQSPSGPKITAPCLALQTPTLILYGELDRVLARESLKQLRHLPNHSVVKLQDAGHACYLHKPKDFHLVLLAFLDHLP